MSGYGWIRIWPCLVLALWLGACTDDTFEEENRSDVVDQTTADSSDELRVNTFMYNVMRTYYYWNDRLPELDTIPDKEPETFFEELVYEGDQFSWLTKEWNGATKSESSSDQYTFSYGFTYSLGIRFYLFPWSDLERSGQLFCVRGGGLPEYASRTRRLETRGYYLECQWSGFDE